jgi:hypothetical protein
MQLLSGASHQVLIGNEDVSEDVTSIHTDQSVETDGDPAKVEIKLANRKSKYVDRYPPIVTHFKIVLRRKRFGKTEDEYIVSQGHVTDLSCDKEPGIAVVSGECEVGHLSDGIPQTLSFSYTDWERILHDILALHDPPIPYHYWAKKKYVMSYQPAQGATFQDVLEDVRKRIGAVIWMDESTDVLNIYDPFNFDRATLDLDYYVSNPDACLSVMGYRNFVNTSGYASEYPEFEEGSETTDPELRIGEAFNPDIVNERKMYSQLIELPETTRREEIQAQATENMNFFRLFKDALTQPLVHGIVPNLFQLVKYTNPNWDSNGTDKVVRGVVLRKVVDYNDNQFETKLEVSRGAESVELLGDVIEKFEDWSDE